MWVGGVKSLRVKAHNRAWGFVRIFFISKGENYKASITNKTQLLTIEILQQVKVGEVSIKTWIVCDQVYPTILFSR